MGNDLGIAGIRCLAAEHGRREGGTAENLVHQTQLDLAIALAAQLGAEMAGPKALRLHLFLQGFDDGAVLRVFHIGGMKAEMNERFDLVLHKAVDPVKLLLEVRLGLEIPCHVTTFTDPFSYLGYEHTCFLKTGKTSRFIGF